MDKDEEFKCPAWSRLIFCACTYLWPLYHLSTNWRHHAAVLSWGWQIQIFWQSHSHVVFTWMCSYSVSYCELFAQKFGFLIQYSLLTQALLPVCLLTQSHKLLWKTWWEGKSLCCQVMMRQLYVVEHSEFFAPWSAPGCGMFLCIRTYLQTSRSFIFTGSLQFLYLV